jgi:hypothetical protein
MAKQRYSAERIFRMASELAFFAGGREPLKLAATFFDGRCGLAQFSLLTLM